MLALAARMQLRGHDFQWVHAAIELGQHGLQMPISCSSCWACLNFEGLMSVITWHVAGAASERQTLRNAQQP